jgi:Mce-associated membrane protein
VTHDGAPVDSLADPVTMLPENDEPRLASWTRRVVAAFLDGAIGTGATFLLLGVPNLPVPFLGASFLFSGTEGAESVPPVSWTDSGWVIVTALLVIAMQAYLGATPGKMVVGIAVVGERNARPIGLLPTVLREFAHIVDAFLFIGYLRPLWNAQRRTFADSIMGTLVLDSRRPRPHRWLASREGSWADPGPPPSWEAAAAPRWRPAATAICTVICVLGVLLSFDSSSQESGLVIIPCVLTTPDNGPAGLIGGSLDFTSVNARSTRLWVTREARGTGGPVKATWEWSTSLPEEKAVSLRSSFARADGTGARHYDYPAPDPTAQEATILLPPEAVKGLGHSWTWTQTILVDGVESKGCTASMPDAVGGVS